MGQQATINNRGGNVWVFLRIAGWGCAALMLLAPLVAMQFSREVNWTASDFAVAGGMLATAGAALEVLLSKSRNNLYRTGAVVAVGSAFLIVWATLAVGFVGDFNHPANLLYGGILAVGAITAILGRFTPLGMARALLATVAAQALTTAIILIPGTPLTAPDQPATMLALNGMFAALFLVSAGLFWRASK